MVVPGEGLMECLTKQKKIEESDWIKINLVVSNREDTLTMLT